MNLSTMLRTQNNMINWQETNGRFASHLHTLHQANVALTRSLNLDEVLQTLLDYLAKLIPYDTANIMLLEEAQQITIHAIRGHECWTDPKAIQTLTFDLNKNRILQNLVHTASSTLIDDTHKHPYWESNPKTDYVRNWLGVPLIANGEVIGLYSLNKAKPNFFTLEHIQLAELLATQAAIAIRNAHLHKQLQTYAQQLEKRVVQRTQQLEKSNEELEAFAHTIAHDLKTPLSGIIGYADVLSDLDGSQHDETRKRYIRTISQKAKQMDSIIHELLMLASMKDDNHMEYYPVNMPAHVERVLMRLDFLISQHSAQIILPEKWAIPLGYGAWIEEILANYISNAIKYGDEQPIIQLLVHETEHTIQFSVQDNGQGIHPDNYATLFTSFSRFDTVRAEGHGLGLSIVARLVEKLNGEYGVHSEWGNGATFWFSLPKYQ